jgi:phage I-like protein
VKPFPCIRVAPWGVTTTTSGLTIVLSRRDGPEIVQASGRVLIDQEFASHAAPDLRESLASVMGDCHLHASSSARRGLQATDIKWSSAGLQALEEEWFRYLVPAFKLGPYGRVERVVGLAFTNIAAVSDWPTIRELLDDQELNRSPKMPRPHAKPQSKRMPKGCQVR